jgi:hypothetical protein
MRRLHVLPVKQLAGSSSPLRLNARLFASYPTPAIQLPKPVFQTDFYTNPVNRDRIHANIVSRKGQGDIDKVLSLSRELSAAAQADERARLESELEAELFRLPNMTHPAVRGLREPRLMRQRPFAAPDYPLRSFEEISRILGGARLENLSLVSGERSYHLMGPLAQLELALVNWAVDKLLQEARGRIHYFSIKMHNFKNSNTGIMLFNVSFF